MKPTTTIAVGAFALLALSTPVFAEAPAYKADKSFGNNDLKAPPVTLAVDAKDQLYVLSEDGAVLIYDAEGNKAGGFKAEMNPAPTAMTVNDGKIYLFNTQQEARDVTYQGRNIKRMVSAGVTCTVCEPTGAKVADFKLPEAGSARDAHFVGKELVIGDLGKSQIIFYELNGTEAKVARKVSKVFRLCCGIFDFCPGSEPGAVVAANLGAFKVQTFADGKKVSEFGKRGDKPEEFVGCCNPVNVGLLPNGSIITVEKGPTRVKVFDKDNKSCTKVTGLSELVQGCSTIPIAVDSKGTIYLASAGKKCVVKCVPGVSDKPEPAEPKEEPMDLGDAPPIIKLMAEKVTPLLQAEEWAKAKAAAWEVVKTCPDASDDDRVRLLLCATVFPLADSGDAEGAIRELEAVDKAYPKSGLTKPIENFKDSIRRTAAAQKENQENNEGEAGE